MARRDAAAHLSREGCVSSAARLGWEGARWEASTIKEVCFRLVSERLGFQYVLPRSSQHPIITSRIALPSIDRSSRRAHIILGIRIPSIANASFEELWHIQQDEWLSFEAFRRSIQEAVNAAAANARSVPLPALPDPAFAKAPVPIARPGLPTHKQNLVTLSLAS
jgi:hypothetical protein